MEFQEEGETFRINEIIWNGSVELTMVDRIGLYSKQVPVLPMCSI
jgi:hypothetical protein